MTNESYLKEFAYNKMIAEWDCQDIAQEVVNKLDKYFQERDISPRSMESFYTALVTLTKFLYKDQSNKFISNNYDDIPALLYFRKRRTKYTELRKIKAKTFNQNTTNKLISWKKVLEIVEYYRKIYETKDYRKPDRHKVKPVTTAKDLQRFLMLSFFTVMPPDRRKTFVELTYGKTLKHGLYDENSVFTPVSELENSKEAKYYISLSDYDYKTWKTYGNWIGEIPNKKYENGKSFYDYISEWLFDGYTNDNNKKVGYRSLLNPQVDQFFITEIGTRVTGCNFSAKVRNAFYRQCGAYVTPHTLRHIYVSHVHKLGLDDATLSSIAYCMKHSSEVAKATYSHLNQTEKLAKSYEAIESVSGLH